MWYLVGKRYYKGVDVDVCYARGGSCVFLGASFAILVSLTRSTGSDPIFSQAPVEPLSVIPGSLTRRLGAE